jgi:putative membrane protein
MLVAMDRRLIWFLGLMVPVLGWSWVNPHDRFTWWLEVVPALIGVPLILAVRRTFPLSTLLLTLIWVHSVVLMVGGHYTYALVPGFGPDDALGRALGWTRNNYDKLGHFAQGFVPAILAREILLRTSPLGERINRADGTKRLSRWLGFLVVSVCLAFSALYELIEWVTAVSQGEAAEAFLGTQGDVWDTQKDMATALVGAVLALVLLSGLHDRSMARVGANGTHK